MADRIYTIQQINPGTIQNAQGAIVRTKSIKFMVGPDGPFTYVVPADQDTPDQITAALTKLAGEILQLRAQ